MNTVKDGIMCLKQNLRLRLIENVLDGCEVIEDILVSEFVVYYFGELIFKIQNNFALHPDRFFALQVAT